MFGQSYGRFHPPSVHHPTMRSFHRSSSARSYFLERGEPSAEKHIQNLVSCAYSFQLVIPSLSRVSLSPHPPGDSHHPLAPPNIIAFIAFMRVVRKRRFQKQVSKSPCSTHQTSPQFRHFFDAFSCDFFAFVLSEINDASIRNPPWYLDEETRRRWWAGAPWRLRLGECVPLF